MVKIYIEHLKVINYTTIVAYNSYVMNQLINKNKLSDCPSRTEATNSNKILSVLFENEHKVLK